MLYFPRLVPFKRERKELEPQHLETFAASCALAAVLRDAGNTEEAEQLYKSALEGYEQLDPYHSETLTTATALALLRQGLGKHHKAEDLFRRVLQRREEQLGAKHLQTLGAVRNLAKNLRSQQKFQEAEEVNELAEAQRLQRFVWEERERVLGADHLETLSSCYALAQLLDMRGAAEEEEVEEMLRRVLEGREKQLGLVNEEVLDVLSRLANFLEKLGEVPEAQKLYMRELQGMEDGEDAEDPEDHEDRSVNFHQHIQFGRCEDLRPKSNREKQEMAQFCTLLLAQRSDE
eukprot:Skav233140  [mRNA]  locus=scaffold792:273824:279896:+ [translate_table: standard]